jgi:hypothetical protein
MADGPASTAASTRLYKVAHEGNMYAGTFSVATNRVIGPSWGAMLERNIAEASRHFNAQTVRLREVPMPSAIWREDTQAGKW